MMVSAGYEGSKGRDLSVGDDLNIPPPGIYKNSSAYNNARPSCTQNGGVYCGRFSAVTAIEHYLTNDYESLTLKFEKRFSKGLGVMSSYVWSKFTDIMFNAGTTSSPAIGGQWYRKESHGLSDADHPDRFVAVVVYDLPLLANWKGKSVKGAAGWLFGAWQVNVIPTFEIGQPGTVTNGDTNNRDYMGNVPLRVTNGNLPGSEQTFYRYFDTSAFVNPPDLNKDGTADYRGNSGRNVIRRPGINNWNGSMFKRFRIFGTEGKNLEFRWEMFNMFNHPQWSSIGLTDNLATSATSTFGRVTGGRAGRRVQFAMKFIF
jgi:hypothetical protein